MPPERPQSRHRLLCWLLALGLLAPGTARAQEDPGRLLEAGRRAFERQNFEEAREKLWAYLDATSNLTGAARMPQAEALYYIALMEPDAAVAGRHYQIIVDEFPASPVADGALYRLAILHLVEGEPELAIQQFEQLRQNYPVSRYQPEIALWIGQARMAADDPAAAIETFQQGFSQVKAGDLPREIPMGQRDALAAEYAHWLARAHGEAGDEATAMQYYTLLTLDYPDSPQAAEARQVLASARGEAPPPALASAAGEQGPEAARQAPEAEHVPPVAVVEPGPPPAEAEARNEEEDQPPRDEEFEDIAVADPVAAAPEGVGRGAGRRAEPGVEEPEAEAAPDRETEREPAQVAAAPITAPAQRPAEEQVAAPPSSEPSEELEPPAKFGPGGGSSDLVYLQVGAFTSATRAADLSKGLKADGFNSTVQIAVVDGRGFYRVRVGPFRVSMDAARIDRDRRRLTELGYPVEQVPVAQ